MEVEYMHVCDHAFKSEGGKACIIGIFDQIKSVQFPATHPYMVIAVQLRGQAHEVAPVRLEFGRPNGDTLAHIDRDVTLGQDGGAFVALTIVAVHIQEPGRYTVKVLSGGRPLATQSIRALRMENPGGPVQGPTH